MSVFEQESIQVTPEIELYPGVINDTVNQSLGMEALFLVKDF